MGKLLPFDQAPFAPNGDAEAAGFNETGWIYVPDGCASLQLCSIHVSFHGCGQACFFFLALWLHPATSLRARIQTCPCLLTSITTLIVNTNSHARPELRLRGLGVRG